MPSDNGFIQGYTYGATTGVIFFNDERNEDGGLTFNGKKTAAGYVAGAGLPFDQFNLDSLGTPSLQVLDADDHVTQQLPEAH